MSIDNYAQLGFCPGSKGDPVFTENFGNGGGATQLPAGTTTYPFSPTPNDNSYAVINHSNFFQPSWHIITDHTPDATNGPSGRMLIVNANPVPGEFFKKTVTGLCVNTTFEFSAWVINLYNVSSNICVAQIPINVRFEIWNATETILLASGDTGNIFGTPAPLWQQFALVFTTVSETTVVLKMKNNGGGGCGNDLAIDDITFSACGDLTTVSSPAVAGTTFTTCANPASIQINANTPTPSFYQWQSSADGVNWTDIPGATAPTFTDNNITSSTFFRTRAAQDASNLSNPFCSTASNVFTVAIAPGPTPAVSNGNRTICSNEIIPALSVTPPAGASVNWYSAATGGTLLLANSASYTPTAAGNYFAETYNPTSGCIGSPRTQVSLTIIPLPDVTMTGTTSVCSGNSATVSFSGTPNAVVTYTVNSGANQTINLNASGSANITTSFTSNTTYTLVSVAAAALSTCSRSKSDVVTITVNNTATATISTNLPAVCQGTSATVNFNGTPNAVVTYQLNAGPNQTISLSTAGIASIAIPSVTAMMNYTLINVSLGGTCTQALSQSISITAIPLPTASVSTSTSTICSGQIPTVIFSGTPNAIVTYTVNSGANQTIALNASGSANMATPLTSNVTYTLVNVTTSGPNACIRNLSSAPLTITVNNSPTASVSTNDPSVCSGSPATIDFIGTPNAIVTYSVNSGANQTITLNAGGNASILIPSVTTTTNYTLVSVASTGPTGCTKSLSQSITLSIAPQPTATITASPLVICSGQTSTVNFNGTPNGIVTYRINGGANQTITLNTGGTASLTATPLVNTTYQLIDVTLVGCSQAVSGSVVISINPTPSATFIGDLTYCNGEPLGISLSSDIVGTTFSWTVNQNGVTGATSGSGNQITQILSLINGISGTATYTITPIFNGCSGNPIFIIVTVLPLPVPQIMDGVICTTGSAPPSSQFYTLNTNLAASDHSFQWFFGGNPIPGASGNTYNATQIGTYTVIATNSAGCISIPFDAVVGEMSQGESLVIQQSEAFSDNPMITVNVIGGDGPYLYQLDESALQSSNVFYDVVSGTHTVTVVDAFCTNLSETVKVLNYPRFFTPNDDGFNDTWNIKGIDNAIIRIFDRYGKLLKQISPDGLGWDGTFNGRILPSTDYWFTLDYIENATSKSFKAHFAIKR